MKKIFIYLTLALCTAILVHSCDDPEQGLQPKGGKACINLSVACVAPSTKASIPGEQNYNENKITHIDWFVFSSDSDGAMAIEHGREMFTDKGNVTEAFTVKSIDMQSHVVNNACSGFVYVIANLPDEYSHDATAGIRHTEGTTTVTDGLTLGALKVLPLTTNFNVVGADNKFQAQDQFVMASRMDIIGWDNYPWPTHDKSLIALKHDIMRGLKGGQSYLLAEQSPNQQNWQPYNVLKRPKSEDFTLKSS